MATSKNKTSFLTIIFKLLYYLVIIFVCLLAIFLLYYIISSQLHADEEDYKPKFSLYTIVSPSMTPVINVYDIVLNIRPETPKDIQVGDIITYKSTAANTDGMTITHRVIAVSQLPDGTYEYMTQGDNNDEPDSLYVTYENVIGKEILIIPYLGRLQFLIANQKGWLILLLIPVTIYLLREIIKLIDLLGLRRKVDKVVGTTEDNLIDRIKSEKLRANERKALIKEELYNKEVKKDSKKRSEYEPSGFLEKYKETTITINENKYSKKTSNSKELNTEISNSSKITTPTKATADKEKVKKNERQKESPLIMPASSRKEEIINEQYEILDTDELTTKIKEYDNKIEKLNKMISDMETIQPVKEENQVEEVNNYLEGSKIKVVKVETAKKRKTSNNKEKTNNSKKDLNLSYDFEFTDLIPVDNIREKIKRPESKDIKQVRSSKENTKKDNKNQKLNLKPNDIKKINRTSKKKTTNNSKNKLNLNPKEIKKVNRHSNTSSKKKNTSNKKQQTKPKNKKRLIVIEKIK